MVDEVKERRPGGGREPQGARAAGCRGAQGHRQDAVETVKAEGQQATEAVKASAAESADSVRSTSSAPTPAWNHSPGGTQGAALERQLRGQFAQCAHQAIDAKP